MERIDEAPGEGLLEPGIVVSNVYRQRGTYRLMQVQSDVLATVSITQKYVPLERSTDVHGGGVFSGLLRPVCGTICPFPVVERPCQVCIHVPLDVGRGERGRSCRATDGGNG